MIVEATYRHVRRMLAAGLRAADVQEIEAGSELSTEAALIRSWAFSEKSWSLLVPAHGPVAMWGVAPMRDRPDIGSPWLLATDQFQYQKRTFLKHTKYYVAEMAKGFRYLTNYTDVRHTESHRWLKWAGFHIYEHAMPYGPKHMPFYVFHRET
jgi:hypothetical protein